MKSSYKEKIDFGTLINTITFLKNPNKIVEFGILNGYSLSNFIENCSSDCKINAYDLFDDFNGNHSNYDDIMNKFNKYKNVEIKKGNFFDIINEFEDYSIDILHIDIANNGDVYEFTFDRCINKIKKGGIILLEGGSIDRDNIYWMKNYNKKPIRPVIEKYMDKYFIHIIEEFPSMTIIQL